MPEMRISSKESYLSSSTSLSKYKEMERTKDTDGIKQFLRERFEERYIAPFEENPNKNGFIMMASACLMIEALESFWNGWKKSPNSSLACCQFFDRNPRFDEIKGLVQEFYTHVRCGIMHQGETTGGWHVRRDVGHLFDRSTKTVDATVFLEEMKEALIDYCSILEKSDWNSQVWQNFRKKMKNVCKNTKSIS